MLKKIKIKEIIENKIPRFIKTNLVLADREGQEIQWEISKTHDSVHILIENTETKELFFVKQVRIPVLVRNPDSSGEVIEACAGIVDKNKSLIQIAQEEIHEEIGYNVPLENISFIRDVKSAVGSSGSNVSLFFATVDESMKEHDGGGLDSEDIEVIKIPFDNVEKELIENNSIFTDSTTLFLTTYWLFKNKH